MVPQIPEKSAGEVVVVSTDPESGRERVMRAAYDLFSRQGTRTESEQGCNAGCQPDQPQSPSSLL